MVAWGAGTTNTGINLNYGQSMVPAGLANVVSIAAGYLHSIALKSDGTVVAWGNNDQSQTTIPAALTSAATANVVAITAGAYHNVALKADGTLVAWGGSNGYGERTVAAYTGITAIAAGNYHNVAVKSDGTVVAWGRNTEGQSTVPTSPVNLTSAATANVVAVAAGGYHSFALQANGNPVAWGYNGFGAVSIPSGLSNVVGLAGGLYHSVALRNAATPFNMAPAITTTPAARQTVTMGQNLTLSVITTGSPVPTYQWKRNGTNLSNGGAISGATSASLTITGSSLVRDSGWYQVVVTNGGGSVTSSVIFVNVTVNQAQIMQWGYAYSFEVPAGLTSVSAVAAGYIHAIALQNTGAVAAWGGGYYGESTVPPAAVNVVGIAGGGGYNTTTGAHTVVVKSDGSVLAWGSGATNTGTSPNYGQSIVPGAATGVVSVAAGGFHSVALKSTGTVVAWGAGTSNTGVSPHYGQSAVPGGLTNVSAIAAGLYHTVALKSDGTVVAWGAGTINTGIAPYYGQSIVPAGLTNVVAIAAGQYHTVALKADGTVVAWGVGTTNTGVGPHYGQSIVPAGLTNVVAIAAGDFHTVALKSDGTAVAWGSNLNGQTSGAIGLTHLVGIAADGLSNVALRDGSTGPVPVITLQPYGTGVNAGTSNTFSAEANEADTFQWQKNGEDIPGATDDSYTTPLTVPQDDHSVYTVEVTNENGTTTSNPAELLVLPPSSPAQTITWTQTLTSPQPYSPTSLTLTASASSLLPVTFSVISGPATVSGLNGTTLTVTGIGTVTVRASQAGYTNSEAVLYYNAAPNVDRSFTVTKASQTITFAGPANQPISPTPIALSASSSSGLSVSFSVLSGPATVVGSQLTVTGLGPVTVRASQAGNTNYNSATNVDRTFTLTKGTPVITWATPADILYPATLGGAQLNATANVAGSFVYSPAAGTVLPGGTHTITATFTPTNPTNYDTVAVQRNITVGVPAGFPVITVQPANHVARAGDPVTFAVTASGAATLTYQWRRNGVDIAGANSATYLISAASTAKAGLYSVVVANGVGTATSNNGILIIQGASGSDFNGDGRPDILLENAASGQRVLWLMGGPYNQYVTLGLDLGFLDPVWRITGMADFNLDSKPDILLENTSSGQRVLWIMGGPNGQYVTLGLDLGFLDPSWRIAGMADFNADGQPDILLENTGSGQRVLWIMAGPYSQYVTLGLDLGFLDPSWRIAGMADFNADGQPDILLENTVSGQRVLWIMAGPYSQYVTQGLDLGFLDPIWRIAGLADFNGDGHPDILLENTSSGQRVLWIMGGPSSQYVTLGLDLGFLDPVWRIAN